MKKFKNNFGVKGSLPLLMALKEEVEKLGWKYDNDFNSWGKLPDLYFNANDEEASMKTQHFSSSNVCECIIYTLPQQWDECLKAASELVEEIPEYVECIQIKIDIPEIKQGHIYKVISYNSNTQHIQVIDEFGDKWDCTNINLINPNLDYCTAFTYSTKEAYEKQQEKIKMQEVLKEVEPWAIGTYVVFLKDYGKSSIGDIDKIENIRDHKQVAILEKENISPGPKDSDEYLKWFPTLQEAEAFSRELLKEEESMEIAGYKVKFKEDKVSIGCYKDITIKDLKIMKKAIKVASKFGKDLTVTEDSIIDNTEDSAIFLDEIEELIERLDG